MANVLSKGTKFPEKVVSQIFNTVKGKSTVAKLADSMPVSFTGNDVFTFAMDGEIAIVAENGTKPANELVAEPVKVTPIKVVYQGRVSDEFMYASEEDRLDILGAFIEGCGKKFAKGLDLMAMHGINPATGLPAASITSHLDQVQSVQVTVGSEDAALDDAIALIGEYDNTGFAISKSYGATLGKMVTSEGIRLYPEFKLGGQPTSLAGVAADVNSTVSNATSKDLAIVGDWSAFKWGYAKDVAVETIEYGDPDQTGVDLKAANQVMLRAEAYIGFAVIVPEAFARVTE